MDRHLRGERIRWLAAASIVAAICGVTALVRVWPAASTPLLPPAAPLAARFVMPVDAPVLPEAASAAPVFAARFEAPIAAVPISTESLAERDGAIADADTLVEPVVPRTAVAPEPIVPEGDPEPVLASRHLEVVFIPADPAPALAGESLVPSLLASSRPFVELPAVAVTRAVTFAGRGIRSGLRVTTAVVRAAF